MLREDYSANTLLGAMAEREVVIPRVGRIAAAATFRLVASMNPYDNVGTTRISASVYDRLCRLAVGYQDAAEETGIVALRTASSDRQLISDAVTLTRATRTHPAVRQGASVRGAIDLVLIATQLRALRDGDPRLLLDAALLALSARITLDETTDTTPEHLITQLWEDLFVLGPARAAPGPKVVDVPDAVALPGRPPLGRLRPGGSERDGGGQGVADGAQGSAATVERGQRERLEDLLEGREPDPHVARMAHRIARRLAVRRRRATASSGAARAGW